MLLIAIFVWSTYFFGRWGSVGRECGLKNSFLYANLWLESGCLDRFVLLYVQILVSLVCVDVCINLVL